MYATQNFPAYKRTDRNFFLFMMILMWSAILSGFGYEMVQKYQHNKLHYPLIVTFHAIAFVGWLVLITTQIILIRTNHVSLHKKLGWAGAILAGIMVILGTITTIIMSKLEYGTPDGDLHFLSVTLGDMLLFGTIAGAGIYLRTHASAHKRLMLVATLLLSDAGYGRWAALKISPLFGNYFWTYTTFHEGFLPFFGFQVLPTLVTILLLGLYDLITRKQLHPVYIWVVGWYLVVVLTASWLYYSPWWYQVAKHIVGVS